MKLLVINGPNINMLGSREAEHYGTLSFADLENLIRKKCAELGVEVELYQSNIEGEIVSKIQQSSKVDGIVINAGAYTHTSIAIRDALLAVRARFIEVHLSNVYSREDFRHKSYLSDKAEGVIAGLKEYSYLLALEYFANGDK